MSIEYNMNNINILGDEYILENQYVVDKNYTKDYNKYCRTIYNRHIGYVVDYNNDKKSGLFIGLDKDLIDNLDKPFSYSDTIMLEDWRMTNGSNYYRVDKKSFKKYITIRDILDSLKSNTDLLKLKHNELNSYIILTDIMKKFGSNCHYYLFFENYY